MILAGNISGTDILGNPMMSVLFCSSLHFLLQIFINFAHKSVLAKCMDIAYQKPLIWMTILTKWLK